MMKVFRFSPTPAVAACSILVVTTALAWAQPVGMNGASIETYFSFPTAETAALVSFDWDGLGTLHYTVGDPTWGQRQEVYKTATPEDVQVYQSLDVFVGPRLTRIGDYMYFNDGGDSMRSAFNYFSYPAATADAVTPLLAYPYGASLWELATRNAGEFFTSGSESDYGPAALFYNTLDASGGFAGALVKFADIGDVPGPLAFDPAGNLFYVPGYAYSGTATIYQWTAAEVASALADPVAAALTPVGHEWAALPAPYSGATGMATDGAGNLYVTATAWGSPSQLLAYRAGAATMSPIAEHTGRLETVRYRDNAVYFSSADGVFFISLLQVTAPAVETQVQVQPGETAVFAVATAGGVGALNYQWYRVSDNKADVPVGGNMPSFSMTAMPADSGAQLYCVVTDNIGAVASPRFTLLVQQPVPVASTVTMIFGALLLAVLGARRLSRKARIF